MFGTTSPSSSAQAVPGPFGQVRDNSGAEAATRKPQSTGVSSHTFERGSVFCLHSGLPAANWVGGWDGQRPWQQKFSLLCCARLPGSGIACDSPTHLEKSALGAHEATPQPLNAAPPGPLAARPSVAQFTSDFYASTQARSLAVDRKMEVYLRGAQHILRSTDASYIMKSFPLQEPAFQCADQHAASAQLR